MKRKKLIWKKDKKLDLLVAQYKIEKTVKFTMQFDTILNRLKAEKQLDKILKL